MKAKNWIPGNDVKSITEKMVEHFPDVFDGFDPDKVAFFSYPDKKSKSRYDCVKLKSIGFPVHVLTGKPYLVEVAKKTWDELTQEQKNMMVFRAMCYAPRGGFDSESDSYAKVMKPEITMHMAEYAATGGIPNWMDHAGLADPLSDEVSDDDISDNVSKLHDGGDILPDDGIERVPITAEDISKAS